MSHVPTEQRELTHCWREQDTEAILRRKEADYWRQQDLGVERDVGGTLREGADAFLATKPEVSKDYRKQMRSKRPRKQGWPR